MQHCAHRKRFQSRSNKAMWECWFIFSLRAKKNWNKKLYLFQSSHVSFESLLKRTEASLSDSSVTLRVCSGNKSKYSSGQTNGFVKNLGRLWIYVEHMENRVLAAAQTRETVSTGPTRRFWCLLVLFSWTRGLGGQFSRIHGAVICSDFDTE